MIRRITALVTALLLLAAGGNALAAGKLTVTEESFYVIPYNDYYEGVVYAAITNTGNKPMQFNTALLELYDTDGNSLKADNYGSCYPDVLQPGETGYIMDYLAVESAKTRDSIADHLLSVTGQSTINRVITAFPVSGTRYEKAMDPGDSNRYAVTVVKNNSDKIVYGIFILFVARDAAKKLIYTDVYILSRVGVMPHTSVEVRESVNWEAQIFMQEHNLEIASVEAVAYTVAYK